MYEVRLVWKKEMLDQAASTHISKFNQSQDSPQASLCLQFSPQGTRWNHSMKHRSQQPISSHNLQELLSATWMEAEPQVLWAQPFKLMFSELKAVLWPMTFAGTQALLHITRNEGGLSKLQVFYPINNVTCVQFLHIQASLNLFLPIQYFSVLY
jgi:hypothetical protein